MIKPLLDDILPKREWVSLTEAATALAFGQALNADEFTRERVRSIQMAEAEYRRDFLAADRAAKSMGWADGWGLDPPPNDQPFVVTEFFRRNDKRRARRAVCDRSFDAAVTDILLGGASGQITFTGCLVGEPRTAPIEAPDLSGLCASPSIGLDTLWNKISGAEWRQVFVRRSDAVRSIDKRSMPAIAAASSSQADETACRKLLMQLMRAAPDAPQPKATVRLRHFSSLSERAFDRAWKSASAEAKAPACTAAGKRPKSPHP